MPPYMSIMFVRPAVEIESTTVVRDRGALKDPLYMLEDNVPIFMFTYLGKRNGYSTISPHCTSRKRCVCMSEREREREAFSVTGYGTSL